MGDDVGREWAGDSEAGARRSRLRDVDSGEQAYNLRVIVLSVAGGVTGFFAVPFWLSRSYDLELVALAAAALAGWALTSAAIYALARGLLGAVAALGGTLVFPSGRSTPAPREYSRHEALVARGRFIEAAAEYEAECLRRPEDPEPRVRLARLHRDELGAPEDALRHFRTALGVASEPARAVAIARELVELATHRLGRPERALPELARLAARHAGTPAGEWAERRLAAGKAALARHSVLEAPERAPDPAGPSSPGSISDAEHA